MIPEIHIKTAMSIDGCIDDESPERRVFSGPEDLEEVDRLRADYDAILVGAGTLRSDNPRLSVRSEKLRQERLGRGVSSTPWKITITASGNLDRKLNFFQDSDAKKLVYAPQSATSCLRNELGEQALLVGEDQERVSAEFVAEDLYCKGVRTLMVEGGAKIISLFLESGLVSKIRLAVAPCFIAQPEAPRFVDRSVALKNGIALELESASRLGQTSVLWYRVRC